MDIKRCDRCKTEEGVEGSYVLSGRARYDLCLVCKEYCVSAAIRLEKITDSVTRGKFDISFAPTEEEITVTITKREE